MKKRKRLLAALLSGILLLAGCASSTEDLNTTSMPPTVAQEKAVEQVDAASAEASLNSLRQAMVETPQFFAVAYFGYHDTIDSDAPEPTEMIGFWELAWTEVEGDRNEAEPGTCGIEIRMAASSGFLMSYTSREFPHNNFENELLALDMREMYYGCGNDAWVGDLEYVGPWDTTYTVTLTVDDILIKQNHFLVDGAPMVSYEYFHRAEERS